MATFMNLQPGRVLDVLQGFGLVPVPSRQYGEVIAYAAKRYAITASGIVLTADDHDGVVLMNQRRPIDSFPVSDKAEAIQTALLRPL